VSAPVRAEDKSVLRFDRVWVREATFIDADDLTDSISARDLEVEIRLEVRVTLADSGQRAFVLLRAVVEPPKDVRAFSRLAASVEGSFTIAETETPRLAEFAHQQAPVLLLPYLRSAITDLTALSRFGPIIIPPLNMMGVVSRMAELARSAEHSGSRERRG